MTVTKEMIEAAMAAFNKTVNEPIMDKCERCDGRGYHHGFGEDGADPDWCEVCGGGGYNIRPGEEQRAMSDAISSALSSRSAEAGKPVVKGLEWKTTEDVTQNTTGICHYKIEHFSAGGFGVYLHGYIGLHGNPLDTLDAAKAAAQADYEARILSALSTPAGSEPTIKAAQITMGRGLVDVTRIEHEGRAGILFRPRAEHIPVGEDGELQAGEYWPVDGDVVIWVENEGGAKVVQDHLSPFLAAPVADSEPNESEIIEAMLANEPFVFDPATNFIHADDGGAPEHGIKYVPAPVADREPVSVPNDVLNDMLLARAPDCRWTIASILKEHGLNRRQRLDYMRSALAAAAPQPNPSKVDASAVIERLTKALNLAADRLDASSHRVGDHDSRAAFGIAQWAIDARTALAAQGEKP